MGSKSGGPTQQAPRCSDRLKGNAGFDQSIQRHTRPTGAAPGLPTVDESNFVYALIGLSPWSGRRSEHGQWFAIGWADQPLGNRGRWISKLGCSARDRRPDHRFHVGRVRVDLQGVHTANAYSSCLHVSQCHSLKAMGGTKRDSQGKGIGPVEAAGATRRPQPFGGAGLRRPSDRGRRPDIRDASISGAIEHVYTTQFALYRDCTLVCKPCADYSQPAAGETTGGPHMNRYAGKRHEPSASKFGRGRRALLSLAQWGAKGDAGRQDSLPILGAVHGHRSQAGREGAKTVFPDIQRPRKDIGEFLFL